jgi:hypothetical protein
MFLVVAICTLTGPIECDERWIPMYGANLTQCQSGALSTMAREIDTTKYNIIWWKCEDEEGA